MFELLLLLVSLGTRTNPHVNTSASYNATLNKNNFVDLQHDPKKISWIYKATIKKFTLEEIKGIGKCRILSMKSAEITR